MRIIKKQFCKQCNAQVDVNVIGDATEDSVPCACTKCGASIEVTKDQTLPQWRKVLFGDTSRRVKNDNQ